MFGSSYISGVAGSAAVHKLWEAEVGAKKRWLLVERGTALFGRQLEVCTYQCMDKSLHFFYN